MREGAETGGEGQKKEEKAVEKAKEQGEGGVKEDI